MSMRATAGLLGSIVAGVCAYASAAAADEVTLRVKTGDFQIKGELVSYDNNKYTIMSSSLGSMSLDASRFDCVTCWSRRTLPYMPRNDPAVTGSFFKVDISPTPDQSALYKAVADTARHHSARKGRLTRRV